jgi:archaemetzincin
MLFFNSSFSVLFSFIACNEIRYKDSLRSTTIAIQPYGFTDTAQLNFLKINIENYYHFKVILLPNKEVPKEAWYAPRSRYKADKLIRILKNAKPDSVNYIMGITPKDISTKKEDIPDYGIMGLGFRPGPSCIVSTFRLKTPNKRLLNERLAKVALHEIGHNVGLPHCTTKDCFMHAAEGSIKQIDAEKRDMCSTCKKLAQLQ